MTKLIHYDGNWIFCLLFRVYTNLSLSHPKQFNVMDTLSPSHVLSLLVMKMFSYSISKLHNSWYLPPTLQSSVGCFSIGPPDWVCVLIWHCWLCCLLLLWPWCLLCGFNHCLHYCLCHVLFSCHFLVWISCNCFVWVCLYLFILGCHVWKFLPFTYDTMLYHLYWRIITPLVPCIFFIYSIA